MLALDPQLWTVTTIFFGGLVGFAWAFRKAGLDRDLRRLEVPVVVVMSGALMVGLAWVTEHALTGYFAMAVDGSALVVLLVLDLLVAAGVVGLLALRAYDDEAYHADGRWLQDSPQP